MDAIVTKNILERNINLFPKVGPVMGKKLAKLNIFTIHDLIYHFPSRYLDFSKASAIADIKVGETSSAIGEVIDIRNIFTKNGKRLTQGKINDGSGDINIIWFNQFFLTKTLRTGMKISISGEVSWFAKKPAFINPEYEIFNPGRTIHTGRLVPIYPETNGVTSKWLRSRIAEGLKIYSPLIFDFLPIEIKSKNNLWDLKDALNEIHFPTSAENSLKARERLGFDEFLLMHLISLTRRNEWKKQSISYAIQTDSKFFKKFRDTLPFQLTNAQERVVQEIFQDIAQTDPMNRLLQGDVGSGKTVVAAAISYMINRSGHTNSGWHGREGSRRTDEGVRREGNPGQDPRAQANEVDPRVKPKDDKGKGLKTIIMAPTEILANQHYLSLQKLLGHLGIKVVLQTGSFKGLKKESDWDLLVGTHALLFTDDPLNNIGLIVIDEQHRFGVEQRNLLRTRSETSSGGEVYVPHFLTMTATPIPRTLALTVYGDLDLSVIDEMPSERIKIKTYVVPPFKRDGAYGFIAKEIDKGRQAFIICPFIEPSESLNTVRSAVNEFEKLKTVFPKYKLGLLHGRLKSKEKDEIMTQFKNNDIDILVSTPVVEVGIDIPNATIIMIESADRFGLASLHQLRGRVGRGSEQSFCLLFTDNASGSSLDRLKALENHHIGMELAEIDMKLRGSGDIVGTAQSGVIDFKIADLNDLVKIERTQKIAQEIITTDADLQTYPTIKEAIQEKLVRKVSPD